MLDEMSAAWLSERKGPVATYFFHTAWDFTDGRDGTVMDSVTFEAASDEEAIVRAKAHSHPDLPVTLRTMLLTTGANNRVVWMTGGPIKLGALV